MEDYRAASLEFGEDHPLIQHFSWSMAIFYSYLSFEFLLGVVFACSIIIVGKRLAQRKAEKEARYRDSPLFKDSSSSPGYYAKLME